MLVDIWRGILIILKFLLWDLWKKAYEILFKKQNEKIKNTYYKRVKKRRK